MKDLSIHILDLGINSVEAGASFVSVSISNDVINNTVSITVTDNGCGMSDEFVRHILVAPPGGNFGYGVPNLRIACESTGGSLTITSEPDVGTSVSSTFYTTHSDCGKIGDVFGSFSTLCSMYPNAIFSIAIGLKSENEKAHFLTDSDLIKEQFNTNDFTCQEVKDYFEENTLNILDNI